MARRDRQPVAAACGRKRQTVSAGLREPDRASLQCAAGSRICRCCCGTGPRWSSPRSDRRRRCSGRCTMPARWCSPMSPRIRHAERAVAAGADGLVLLTAGAGGQTGWLNPFVFVRAVRAFFDGPIVLAGGISDGHALRAAAGARLRPRLYGHQVHRHAREHGGCQIQGDAGRQQRRRHPADHGVHGIADQHAAARRSRPPASIRTICRSVARSISARTSTSARARTAPNAGRTSGARGIPSRA